MSEHDGHLYRRGVGVMLLNRDGKVFVGARIDNTDEAWQMPQGGIDEGEEPWATALREVEEETGARGRSLGKLGDVRYAYTQTWGDAAGERVFKIVSFYLVRYSAGRLGAIAEEMRREVDEVRWLPLADAERALAYRGERQMAAKALAMIRERCPPTR